MDNEDKKNLEFLLTSSQETLKNWYDSVGDDDHKYAQRLLFIHKQSLEMIDMKRCKYLH